MTPDQSPQGPILFDEEAPRPFRAVFGDLIARSSVVETAIHRIRLGAVDLSTEELRRLESFRVLVAEVNAGTTEAEVYAMALDPVKRKNLGRILGLLKSGVMEIRAAPLAGWSPDFSVFSSEQDPQSVVIGLHWFHQPFPHRGPAWAGVFGPMEAARARIRFLDLWGKAHDIGPAVQRMMETTSSRGAGIAPRRAHRPVDTPNHPG